MDYQNHDGLLQRLAPFDCVLSNGLSNHAPMVVEALAAMHSDEYAPKWLADYEHLLSPRPAQHRSISASINNSGWQSAVSDNVRYADWVVFFDAEIKASGWKETCQVWVGLLVTGFLSAACHGVIRVGHAVRALKNAQTPQRLHELSCALASWCVSYQPLAEHVPEAGTFNGDMLLRNLPLLDSHLRRNKGSITAGVAQLVKAPEILRHIQKLQAPRGQQDYDRLASLAAQVFLNNVTSKFTAIVFTHGITACGASIQLAPLLGMTDQHRLYFQCFLAIAALHAAYAKAPLGSREEAAMSDSLPTLTQLQRSAVEHGDEHVIKLAEVATQFYRRSGDVGLLMAAQACQRLIDS